MAHHSLNTSLMKVASSSVAVITKEAGSSKIMQHFIFLGETQLVDWELGGLDYAAHDIGYYFVGRVSK